MRAPLRSLALFAAALAFAGCATLFTGTHDDVHFASEPEGAEVYIGGLYVGETPVTVPVRRRSFGDTEVTLRTAGYEPLTFVLRQEFNTVSVLNLADAFGWGIDVATGAVMRYERGGYLADFERGFVAHDVEALPRDDAGRLVVSPAAEAVAVVDKSTGLGYVFSR